MQTDVKLKQVYERVDKARGTEEAQVEEGTGCGSEGLELDLLGGGGTIKIVERKEI